VQPIRHFGVWETTMLALAAPTSGAARPGDRNRPEPCLFVHIPHAVSPPENKSQKTGRQFPVRDDWIGGQFGRVGTRIEPAVVSGSKRSKLMTPLKPHGHKPPFEPTQEQRDQVFSMAAQGMRREDIARALRIGQTTLRKYFREELETSSIKANATIGSKLFENAKNGDVVAMCFWLTFRAGWKETNIGQHVGKAKIVFPPWYLEKPGPDEDND
jgi:hypothetical protein